MKHLGLKLTLENMSLKLAPLQDFHRPIYKNMEAGEQHCFPSNSH